VAIDIAEHLVAVGVPFRQAHEVAGGLAGRAVREGMSLVDVVVEDSSLAQLGEQFERGATLSIRHSPESSVKPVQSARLAELIASLRSRSRLQVLGRNFSPDT
jgi:argininosuccinate lyase